MNKKLLKSICYLLAVPFLFACNPFSVNTPSGSSASHDSDSTVKPCKTFTLESDCQKEKSHCTWDKNLPEGQRCIETTDFVQKTSASIKKSQDFQALYQIANDDNHKNLQKLAKERQLELLHKKTFEELKASIEEDSNLPLHPDVKNQVEKVLSYWEKSDLDDGTDFTDPNDIKTEEDLDDIIALSEPFEAIDCSKLKTLKQNIEEVNNAKNLPQLREIQSKFTIDYPLLKSKVEEKDQELASSLTPKAQDFYAVINGFSEDTSLTDIKKLGDDINTSPELSLEEKSTLNKDLKEVRDEVMLTIKNSLDSDGAMFFDKSHLDEIASNPGDFSPEEVTLATNIKTLLETTNKDDIVKASQNNSDPKLQKWAQDILRDETSVLKSGPDLILPDSSYIKALEETLEEKKTDIEKCTTPEEIDKVDSIGSEYLEKLKTQQKSKLVSVKLGPLLGSLKDFYDNDQVPSNDVLEKILAGIDAVDASKVSIDLIKTMLSKDSNDLSEGEKDLLKALVNKKGDLEMIYTHLGVDALANKLFSGKAPTRSMVKEISSLLASKNLTDEDAEKLFLSLKAKLRNEDDNGMLHKNYLNALSNAYFDNALTLNRTKNFIAELTKEEKIDFWLFDDLKKTYLNLVKSFSEDKADYELLRAIATKPLLAIKVLGPWLKDHDKIPPLTKSRLVNIVLENLDFAKIIKEKSFNIPLQEFFGALKEKAEKTSDFDETIVKLLDNGTNVNSLIKGQDAFKRMMIEYVEKIQELENQPSTENGNAQIKAKLQVLSGLLRYKHNLYVLITSAFYPTAAHPLKLSASIKEIIKNLYNQLPSKDGTKTVLNLLPETFTYKENLIETLNQARTSLSFFTTKTDEEKANLDQALQALQDFINSIVKSNP